MSARTTSVYCSLVALCPSRGGSPCDAVVYPGPTGEFSNAPSTGSQRTVDDAQSPAPHLRTLAPHPRSLTLTTESWLTRPNVGSQTVACGYTMHERLSRVVPPSDKGPHGGWRKYKNRVCPIFRSFCQKYRSQNDHLRLPWFHGQVGSPWCVINPSHSLVHAGSSPSSVGSSPTNGIQNWRTRARHRVSAARD